MKPWRWGMMGFSLILFMGWIIRTIIICHWDGSANYFRTRQYRHPLTDNNLGLATYYKSSRCLDNIYPTVRIPWVVTMSQYLFIETVKPFTEETKFASTDTIMRQINNRVKDNRDKIFLFYNNFPLYLRQRFISSRPEYCWTRRQLTLNYR